MASEKTEETTESASVDPNLALIAGVSIAGQVAGLATDVFDFFGEGETEQVQAQSAATIAAANASTAATAATPIGWITANPITAAAVFATLMYVLVKISNGGSKKNG